MVASGLQCYEQSKKVGRECYSLKLRYSTFSLPASSCRKVIQSWTWPSLTYTWMVPMRFNWAGGEGRRRFRAGRSADAGVDPGETVIGPDTGGVQPANGLSPRPENVGARSGSVFGPLDDVFSPAGPKTPPCGLKTGPCGPKTSPCGPKTPAGGLKTPARGLTAGPGGPKTPAGGPTAGPGGLKTPPSGPTTLRRGLKPGRTGLSAS